MMKRLTTFLVAFILICNSAIRAEVNFYPDANEDELPSAKVGVVGKAASDGISTAKSRQIQNICIAAAAAAIAITTVILVSKHHHHHHHSHSHHGNDQ